MFYKFAIDLSKLQDDQILPKKMEKDTIFYEIVIKSDSNAILRIPFDDNSTTPWKIELYDNDTEIAEIRRKSV